jgi:integrase
VNPARRLILRVPESSLPMLRRRKLASGGGPLFPTWNGEWLDPSNVIHRIQGAFAEVGYGWVTSHVFRKTVASVLDEADLPLSTIADPAWQYTEGCGQALPQAPGSQ